MTGAIESETFSERDAVERLRAPEDVRLYPEACAGEYHDDRAAQISRRLARRILAEIDACGWIGFERYMERALYEPELGYYRNGGIKFGPGGDFVTAPELSPWLAGALARRIEGVLRNLDDPVVLEVGAGDGRLAVDLIQALDDRHVRPRYWILETSPELRDRQRERCAAVGVEARWLDDFPEEPFQGAIVANEVLDAFPATRFVKCAGEVRPLGVGRTDDGFGWVAGRADGALSRQVDALERRLGRRLPDGYRSEISRRLPPWMDRVAAALERGAAFIVDYGLTEAEYYHPERIDGSLICHYRHRAHDDPFRLPGLQDISAWVDFSACARAARRAGLAVTGYTTQGHFLVESAALTDTHRSRGASDGAGARAVGAAGFGAANRTGDGAADGVADESGIGAAGGAAEIAAMQALKTLVLPGAMGERFKLLVLSRGMRLEPPPGRDLRERL